MAELLTSIPGDIPGLLRRGSPVIHDGERAVFADDPSTWSAEDLAHACLDLTDKHGRVDAAWWAEERAPGTTVAEVGHGVYQSITERAATAQAMRGADMTPLQIDVLARLVLRLAGR